MVVVWKDMDNKYINDAEQWNNWNTYGLSLFLSFAVVATYTSGSQETAVFVFQGFLVSVPIFLMFQGVLSLIEKD